MFKSKRNLSVLAITLIVAAVVIVTAFWKTGISSGTTDLRYSTSKSEMVCQR